MIKVNYRALGMLSTNCYVVENPDSQKVLIVDPGDSPLEIERQIDEIDRTAEARSDNPFFAAYTAEERAKRAELHAEYMAAKAAAGL